MNTLKNTLAALFVGEIAYFTATLVFLLIGSGISFRKALGIGAVLNVATSPVVVLIGLAAFVGALVLFSRY